MIASFITIVDCFTSSYTKHRMRIIGVFITLFVLCSIGMQASEKDSLHRYGFLIEGMPGRVLATDGYVKKWLHKKNCFSIAAELHRVALPCDSDAFASDFNYPMIGLGIRYAFNHHVTMRRYDDPDWGKLVPVDFDSRLGNTFSLYLNFTRPFVRTHSFETGYALHTGLGYSHSKYNKTKSPDNELIGSHWLIYFGATFYAQYRFTDNWAIRAGLDFYHHSNGALNRPNKGSNTAGPSLSLVYLPYYKEIIGKEEKVFNPPFKKYFYFNFTAGIGGKTLLEDWQVTQFETDPSEAEYRTEDFKLYSAYSFQADFMYRYARRWASGIGADVFYGSYSDRVAEIDQSKGLTLRHSPWSAGLALKHQAYFHNLSVAMSFGVYLFRHMGRQAKIIETPYYERIGLHYTFPKLQNLELGINIKAHKTKADLTEFVISMPLRLKKSIGKANE